jgi:hypothetical protein
MLLEKSWNIPKSGSKLDKITKMTVFKLKENI